MKLNVLHFDDNPYDLEGFAKALREESIGPEYTVCSVSDESAFKKALETNPSIQIIVLDLHVQKQKANIGLILADFAKKTAPHAVIIMRSSYTDPKSVATSLAAGADDFISKTAERGELCLRLLNSYELARHKRGTAINDHKRSNSPFAGKTMESIAQRIPRIVDSAVMAVHIHGEPGTGKEVVADLFQAHVGSGVPFIKVNCGAIAPTLLESELFGHAKGAFTGALGDRKGFIEEAHGGWIFLDEIATLPMNAQIALLRVIENQEVKPLGSSKSKKVKVRLISATNESLEELVKKGTFRKDLWQRLIEVSIDIPPLRHRTPEIPALIDHFCLTMQQGPYKITDPAKDLLAAYTWPEGNIRELRNCLRAMTEYTHDKTLSPLAIPARILEKIDLGDETLLSSTSSNQNQTASVRFDIAWNHSKGIHFDDECDRLLVKLIFAAYADNQRLSIRGLAKLFNFPKTSMGERIRKLIEKKLLTREDATKMLGLEW